MKRTAPKKLKAVKPVRRSFKAASIQAGSNCCQAIQELAEDRYLLDKLPRLPLDSCDRVASCKCSFTNHSDRREGDDRRIPTTAFRGIVEDGSRDVNNRSGKDRRTGFNDELKNISFD